MEHRKIDWYIRLILRRLKKLHRENGSWADNNFINALVGYSLSEMGAPAEMLDKTADYIFSQKSAKWSWNYYSAEKQKNLGKKYPDDLDDTFCSLIALLKIKPEIITRDMFNNTVNIMTHSASKTGGPYFTWVGGVWDDIDPVVNANISCFYSSLKIEMPRVTEYIDACLKQDHIPSKYYHNALLSYYFIARNYRGLKRNTLIRKIIDCIEKAEAEGDGISLTEIALAACALARLCAPFNTIDHLIKKIKICLDSKTIEAGIAEKNSLYIEKIIAGTKHYASSIVFSLALCGEAISLHKKETDLLNEIQSTAQKRCKSLPNPLRSETRRMLDKMFSLNPFKDILLMPYRIAFPPSDTAISCGLISLYGWMAYTIYDRIIDEKENADLLPLANLFHREMIVVCRKTAGRKNWHLCQEIFDAMDCAEMRERRKQKSVPIPSKKQIVEKSIGLIVPSILALIHCGMPPDGPEIKKFTRLFKNYVFVRQMSDDLRDWRNDLKHGIITRVTGRTKDGLAISANEIVSQYQSAKKTVGEVQATSREVFLLNLIEEYATAAKKFLEKQKTRRIAPSR